MVTGFIYSENIEDNIRIEDMSGSKRMDEANKKIVVPLLRELGFKGSYPNFSRVIDDQIDSIFFQHHRYTGSLCVNIEKSPVNEKYTLTMDNVQAFMRLGSHLKTTITDHWFVYNPNAVDLNYEKSGEETFGTIYRDSKEGTRFELIANDIKELCETFLINWFEETRGKWVEDLSEDPNPFYNAAEELFENGEFEKAIENYTKAIEIKPDDPAFYLKRGLSYQNISNFSESDKDYEVALKLFPMFEFEIQRYKELR